MVLKQFDGLAEIYNPMNMYAINHNETKKAPFQVLFFEFPRSRADSNRCGSFCRALPSHSATGPFGSAKVQALYQTPKKK